MCLYGHVLVSYIRKGIDKGQLRFLVDGSRVQPNDTPASLDLEDNDQIDVVLEQLGGGF